MAYITSEQVKQFRNNLKEAFPRKDGWKFSVRKRHYSTVMVYIMEAPYKFLEDVEGGSINHFYPEKYEHSEDLKKIIAICNDGNFDKSDPMTDYFHVGWYFDLYQGQWNKPFKLSDNVLNSPNINLKNGSLLTANLPIGE